MCKVVLRFPVLELEDSSRSVLRQAIPRAGGTKRGRYCDRRTRRYWCVQAEAQQEKPKRKLFPSVPLGGATNSQVKLAYHNQCVAIASPQASQTGAFFASAAEVGDAKENAMAGCGKK